MSGKSNNLGINLAGRQSYQTVTPFEIKRIKIEIMKNFLLPLISKQWSVLHENMFMLEKIKKKVDLYYSTYQLDDLLLYKEMINAFEIMIFEHDQLDTLEKQMYRSEDNISTVIYKTSMIRLKPEYELYDLIVGKPIRRKNEKYDEATIHYIHSLLKIENINFPRIKENVIHFLSKKK